MTDDNDDNDADDDDDNDEDDGKDDDDDNDDVDDDDDNDDDDVDDDDDDDDDEDDDENICFSNPTPTHGPIQLTHGPTLPLCSLTASSAIETHCTRSCLQKCCFEGMGILLAAN